MKILHGSHKDFKSGACAMEIVSWLAGEKHSDSPRCTCPVIASLVRGLNDRMGAGKAGDKLRDEILKPLLPKLLGTRGSRQLMVRRAYLAANAAVHEYAPAALEARKRPDLAKRLREAPEIVDRESALKARDIAREVRAAYAAAAASAAYAAAAASAAYAAAASAAYAADAASDAAADAASDAAYAAAGAARRSGYEAAAKLIERMCELKDEEAAA
jgi:hypothetical protein